MHQISWRQDMTRCERWSLEIWPTNKWYMHKSESFLQNEEHKIVWDFKIQMHHLIQARRTDLMLINKRKITCNFVDFAVPADHRVKIKERQKRWIFGSNSRS